MRASISDKWLEEHIKPWLSDRRLDQKGFTLLVTGEANSGAVPLRNTLTDYLTSELFLEVVSFSLHDKGLEEQLGPKLGLPNLWPEVAVARRASFLSRLCVDARRRGLIMVMDRLPDSKYQAPIFYSMVDLYTLSYGGKFQVKVTRNLLSRPGSLTTFSVEA